MIGCTLLWPEYFCGAMFSQQSIFYIAQHDQFCLQYSFI